MKFSVIIPVRYDAAGLEVALGGLRQQLHLPDEVIVVNASAEPLSPSDAPTLPLRVTEAGPSFPGKARNAGGPCGHASMARVPRCRGSTHA